MQSVWGAHKQQEKLLTSHDMVASHTRVCSPGVKGLPGEQGAIVVVSDEVRRRCGTVAAGRLADCTDLDLVLGVPYVQQENVVHQHGVGRNHTACRKNTHHQHTHISVDAGGGGGSDHLSRCSRRPGVAGW